MRRNVDYTTIVAASRKQMKYSRNWVERESDYVELKLRRQKNKIDHSSNFNLCDVETLVFLTFWGSVICDYGDFMTEIIRNNEKDCHG